MPLNIRSVTSLGIIYLKASAPVMAESDLPGLIRLLVNIVAPDQRRRHHRWQMMMTQPGLTWSPLITTLHNTAPVSLSPARFSRMFWIKCVIKFLTISDGESQCKLDAALLWPAQANNTDTGDSEGGPDQQCSSVSSVFSVSCRQWWWDQIRYEIHLLWFPLFNDNHSLSLRMIYI